VVECARCVLGETKGVLPSSLCVPPSLSLSPIVLALSLSPPLSLHKLVLESLDYTHTFDHLPISPYEVLSSSASYEHIISSLHIIFTPAMTPARQARTNSAVYRSTSCYGQNGATVRMNIRWQIAYRMACPGLWRHVASSHAHIPWFLEPWC
jgi:hypothetical protein